MQKDIRRQDRVITYPKTEEEPVKQNGFFNSHDVKATWGPMPVTITGKEVKTYSHGDTGIQEPPVEEMRVFESGCVRSTDSDEVRYDLIPPIALRRLAARYKMGADKYGEYNWQKGMPLGVVINHLQNHLEKFKLEGCIDDDNLAAIAWGAFALMWYEANKPELFEQANIPL